jgi:hypothetical protein
MLIFIKYIVPLNPGSGLLTLLCYEDFQLMKQLQPYKKGIIAESFMLPGSLFC